LSSLQIHHLYFLINLHNSPTPFRSLPSLYPITLTQSAVNTQLPHYLPSHHLFNPPNTLYFHHTIPPTPFPSHLLHIHPNTICCLNTIPPLPSLPTLYPITLTQSVAKHTIPPTTFPSHPLSNHPKRICCLNTMPPLPSLPTIYTIPLTQSAVNTQFPRSLPFPPSIQSP